MNRTITPSTATQISEIPGVKKEKKEKSIVIIIIQHTVLGNSSKDPLQYIIIHNDKKKTKTIKVSTKSKREDRTDQEQEHVERRYAKYTNINTRKTWDCIRASVFMNNFINSSPIKKDINNLSIATSLPQ